MQNVIEILQGAIDSGTVVTIVYNGGSKPGLAREIIPLALNGDNLSAREPTSRRSKTFKIQKIASAILKNGEAAENLEAVPAPPQSEVVPAFESFEEYALFLKKKFRGTEFNLIEEENYFLIRTNLPPSGASALGASRCVLRHRSFEAVTHQA